jgi:cytochrome c oxidase subunit 2
MRGTWYVFLAVAAVVAAFVYGSIFWCIFAYRRGKRDRPAQFSGNPPLEILYTVIPVAIVVALFVFTYLVEMPVDRVDARPQGRVHVTAFRWSWRFDYGGTAISTTGTPVAPPTLYLPVNRTTEIDLDTADVNHSFWVPAFLFKRDAIPGMTNVFDLTPRTIGRYTGRCAQFCGLEHALMSFTVEVVPDAQYDRFIASNGTAKP